MRQGARRMVLTNSWRREQYRQGAKLCWAYGMAWGVVYNECMYSTISTRRRGWKEQASERQQKKERRQDCPGIKEGTLRPEWLGRVRVRRGEERERKFEHRQIQSVDGQRRPDKPRTGRGSGIWGARNGRRVRGKLGWWRPGIALRRPDRRSQWTAMVTDGQGRAGQGRAGQGKARHSRSRKARQGIYCAA